MRRIRLATHRDLHHILRLIDCGRQKMRDTGNQEQWTDGNPSSAQILHDINCCCSYILEDDGMPIATFAFIKGPDVTYNEIFHGEWTDDTHPYYVIHRIASAPNVHGVLSDVLDYCFTETDNIRIDTHRDNIIMRTALPRYGFAYCGIIYLLDGAERLAYQCCRK